MRPARLLLATATATVALAMAAPVAYATAGDWDKDDSSYSSEHHDDSRKYDEPRGGMHTGGGALTAVNEDDWSKDKDKKDEESKKEESKKDGYEKDHDKGGSYEEPRGGMHTGGGALAAVNEDDWTKDKDKKDEESKEDEYGHSKDGYEGSGGYEHEKPRGGMDTGGGALATSGGGMAAGSALLLGGLGAGAYMVRRRGVNAPTA